MNTRLITTISVIIATICCCIFLWLYTLYAAVISQDNGYTYYLRPGISKRLVINELSQAGIIRHPLIFSFYTSLQRNAQLKTGEYLFRRGSTPLTIWKQITTGTGLIQHPLMIIPGWTFIQVRHALDQAPSLRHLSTTMEDKQIMTLLGHPELAPEGEFYPETYYYTRDASDIVMLKRAFDLMQNRLQEAWQHRSSGLPYKNAYEALIAASLIEKEAYLESERPMIGGVLLNRLKKDMLLQIDATVIYGLGTRYDGKIHKSNLLEDTVYNTYVHKGLPPTPIAMPGQSSIDAAMHPQLHDYYYYVAKGDGSHQFSKSLREHNAAVQSVTKLRTGYFNESLIRQHVEFLLNRVTPRFISGL